MLKETLDYIDNELTKMGFKKKRPGDGWRIFTLGDNYFDVTKRFARFEIRLVKNKVSLSAMTATAVKERDRVSKIDWALSKRVSRDDVLSTAKKMIRDLKTNMKQVEKGK